MKHQLDAGGPGQHFARQVVQRRADAAGCQHEAGTAGSGAEDVEVSVEVVGDGRVPTDGDAILGQPPAKPLAVGIEVLPTG